MKNFAFWVISLAVLLSFEAAAQSYGRPYCMEISEGWGGSRRDCSYESFEHCYANKLAFNATCSPNPAYGKQKRKKYG